jgi:Uma2 family endonuclease
MSTEVSARITWEDIERMPEDGRRHEIIHGEYVVNAAPRLRHQFVVRNLEFILHAFSRERKLGEVVQVVEVLFPDDDLFVPDLIFVSNERRSILTDKRLVGAPDLAVEVLSNSTRRHDEIEKRITYEKFGVVEYWLVDADANSVKVYRRDASGTFAHPLLVTLTEDKILTSSLFPGLTIDLREVFAENFAE